MNKVLNWLTCKPWLFTIKIFILFLIFLFLHYFTGPEGSGTIFGIIVVLEFASYFKISPQEEI